MKKKIIKAVHKLLLLKLLKNKNKNTPVYFVIVSKITSGTFFITFEILKASFVILVISLPVVLSSKKLKSWFCKCSNNSIFISTSTPSASSDEDQRSFAGRLSAPPSHNFWLKNSFCSCLRYIPKIGCSIPTSLLFGSVTSSPRRPSSRNW